MNDITYGFVDSNNILKEIFTIQQGDTDTVNRIKIEFNLPNAYPMDLNKELALLGSAYWNGSRFVWPSPHPSWHFDEEINGWNSPVPYPEDDRVYLWDEESIQWVLEVSPTE